MVERARLRDKAVSGLQPGGALSDLSVPRHAGWTHSANPSLEGRAAGKRDSCPVCEVRCRGLDRDNLTGVVLPTAAQMRKLRHCKVATSLSQGCANRACCCQSPSPGSRSDQRPGSLQGRASGRPGPWAPERHPQGLVSPLLPHSGPPRRVPSVSRSQSACPFLAPRGASHPLPSWAGG